MATIELSIRIARTRRMGVREKFSFFRFPPITKRRQIGHEHDTRPNPPKRPDTRIREPVRLWTKSDLPSGAQNQIFFQVPTLCESNIRNDLAHPPSLAQRIQSKSPLEVCCGQKATSLPAEISYSLARGTDGDATHAESEFLERR